MVGFEILSGRGGALFLIDDSGGYIDAFLAKLLKAVLLALQDVLHDFLRIVGKAGTEFFRLKIQKADGHHLFAFNGRRTFFNKIDRGTSIQELFPGKNFQMISGNLAKTAT